MKKKISVLFVTIAMIAMLFVLTGCGGNKLVATKTTEDSFMGKYEEKMEISFKNDKADKIVWTQEFESEEKAEAAAAIYKLATTEAKMEVEQKGKKVTIKMAAKDFADEDDDSMSKEDMKKELEEQGYTVK